MRSLDTKKWVEKLGAAQFLTNLEVFGNRVIQFKDHIFFGLVREPLINPFT